MELFDIQVVNPGPRKIAGKPCAMGQIIIGDFSQTFLMTLDEWEVCDYERQWREGLERIKTHDTSCLIADITTMKINPRLSTWVLYKINTSIVIQNKFLGGSYMKKLSKRLPRYTASSCYLYIMPHKNYNKRNQEIDEWCMQQKDFFASTQRVLDNEITVRGYPEADHNYRGVWRQIDKEGNRTTLDKNFKPIYKKHENFQY